MVFVIADVYAFAAAQRHHSGGALVGVDRGTDLMLYAMIIAFSFTR